MSASDNREGLLLKNAEVHPIKAGSLGPRHELVLVGGPAFSMDRIETGMSGALGAD